MIDRLAETVDPPTCDILSWAFASNSIVDHHPIWVDPYTGHIITRSQALQTVRQLISGLRYHGVKNGDTLCLHSFNSVYYPLIYLAAVGTGARFVGSNPAYKASEISHLLRTSDTKFLIVQDTEVENVLPTALKVGIASSNIFALESTIRNTPVSLKSWTTLFNYGQADWRIFTNDAQSKQTAAVLLSTSGTTGLPKIAVMSHYAILTQAVHAEYVVASSTNSVRRLVSLPMFHSFVLPYHLLALRLGHTTYVMPRFDADHFACFIEKYEITDIPTVPPVAQRIFGGGKYTTGDFGTVRDVVCAGAPMSKNMQARLSSRLLDAARFTQLWGMSETGWVTAFKHPENDDSGSVGRLLPDIRAKIVDNDGCEVQEEGAKGEICVKHPGLMMGYLGNTESTEACFDDGWFKTGDIGYFEADKWYIVDRAKEMIKVRAWAVGPAEIEACINGHPSVADVAVVGITRLEDKSEGPVAFVGTAAPTTEQNRLAEEIKAKVRCELASYKALAEVVFVDSIPRTASGKILRRVLRDQYIATSAKINILDSNLETLQEACKRIMQKNE